MKHPTGGTPAENESRSRPKAMKNDWRFPSLAIVLLLHRVLYLGTFVHPFGGHPLARRSIHIHALIGLLITRLIAYGFSGVKRRIM